jgi:hypothetical protein
MRRIFVVVMTLGAIVLTAGSAMAKGPSGPVAGKLVITGPGLDRPIVVQEDVYWSPEYGVAGSTESSGGLTEVLQDLGLLGAGPEVGWYELPPDPSTLGPGYSVQEYLDVDGTVFGAAATTVATLYPYASDRPLVLVSVQLPRSTGRTRLWWSAPPSLHSWLLARGLPALPPSAPAHLPPRLVVPQAPSSLPVILFALLGLATLVTVGTVAGRRQAARAG